MSGRWWRAYDEALDDPKVQNLSPELFKFWFNVLCVASRYGGVLPPEEALKTLLRSRLDHLKRHLSALLKGGLLEVTPEGLVPHNWMKRQYKSDTSTDRVRRHRNVSETFLKRPQSTDTDTEKKDSPLRGPPSRPKAVARGARLPPAWMPSDDGARFAEEKGLTREEANRELEKFTNYWLAKSGADAAKLDWNAVWRNWVLRATENRGGNGHGRPKGQFASDRARELAREVRERELAAGLFGSSPSVGGH